MNCKADRMHNLGLCWVFLSYEMFVTGKSQYQTQLLKYQSDIFSSESNREQKTSVLGAKNER